MYRRAVPRGLPVGIKGVFQKVYLLISKGCLKVLQKKVYLLVPEGVFQEVYLLVSKGCSKRSTCWYKRGVPKGLPVGNEGVFQKVYLLLPKGCSKKKTCCYQRGVPKGLPVEIEGVFQKV